MNAPAVELNQESTALKACQICGRTFHPKSLERHEVICAKTKKANHRNVFNSFLQRARETGVAPITVQKEDEKCKSKSKWKEKHENPNRTVRAENGVSKESLNNGSSPEKPMPPGYVQCPSCRRCFNYKAADRHITWCQEQQSRLPKMPPNLEALERLKTRIKYRAPLPGKKGSREEQRLIKSADSFRGPSILRTHSSPPVPGRGVTGIKCSPLNNNPCLSRRRKGSENKPCSDSSTIHGTNHYVQSLHISETQSKKAVKFKEQFPDYNKQRNTNVDMLKALRLQLSKLDTSEEYMQECFYRTPVTENVLKNNNKVYQFPAPVEFVHEPWSSDGEVHCSTSSSSDGSLPSVSREGSSEQRMPRFCYNCGTKYPIVSAKFCCECGARRLIFRANDNYLPVS